jgi:hypothetical protein
LTRQAVSQDNLREHDVHDVLNVFMCTGWVLTIVVKWSAWSNRLVVFSDKFISMTSKLQFHQGHTPILYQALTSRHWRLHRILGRNRFAGECVHVSTRRRVDCLRGRLAGTKGLSIAGANLQTQRWQLLEQSRVDTFTEKRIHGQSRNVNPRDFNIWPLYRATTKYIILLDLLRRHSWASKCTSNAVYMHKRLLPPLHLLWNVHTEILETCLEDLLEIWTMFVVGMNIGQKKTAVKSATTEHAEEHVPVLKTSRFIIGG